MKTLSIWEFEEYCNRSDHNTYIYSTSNQKESIRNVRGVGIYNCIHFTYNPNTIIFKNGRNNLCFDSVKNIVVHSDNNGVGKIIDIICSGDNQGKDESYTILEL